MASHVSVTGSHAIVKVNLTQKVGNHWSGETGASFS